MIEKRIFFMKYLYLYALEIVATMIMKRMIITSHKLPHSRRELLDGIVYIMHQESEIFIRDFKNQ